MKRLKKRTSKFRDNLAIVLAFVALLLMVGGLYGMIHYFRFNKNEQSRTEAARQKINQPSDFRSDNDVAGAHTNQSQEKLLNKANDHVVGDQSIPCNEQLKELYQARRRADLAYTEAEHSINKRNLNGGALDQENERYQEMVTNIERTYQRLFSSIGCSTE